MLLFFTFISQLYNYPGIYEHTLKAGRYKIICAGAQGGSGYNNNVIRSSGGRGAIVSGTITITGTGRKVYVYVGGQGATGNVGPNPGGFNGGGNSGYDTGIISRDDAAGGGGGASDVRLIRGQTNSRVIVASGGSGGAFDCNGAPGGIFYSYKATRNNYYVSSYSGTANGVGENGINSDYGPGSGGGGGFLGGLSSYGWVYKSESSYKAVAESGSSYISGYPLWLPYNGFVFDDFDMTSGYSSDNYGNGYVDIQTIFQCPSNCYSCMMNNQCTKCFDNYFLHLGSQCVDKCPFGYINVGDKCEPCTTNCKICTVPQSTCQECFDNFYLHNGQCLSKCPSGYTNIGKECKICDSVESHCSECETTQTKCTSCVEGYFLTENKCVVAEECPFGTVALEGVCEECTENCETCAISPKTCLSCKEGTFLFKGHCISSCPSGFTKDGRVCVRCDYTCQECSTTPTTCTSCPIGYYKKGTECVIDCPNGFYDINGECKSCNTDCGTCEEKPEKCTSCTNGKYLDMNTNKCIDSCPKGTLGINNKCEKCKSFCATCEGDLSSCTSCIDGFDLNGTECIQICPSGMTLIDGECVNCSDKCAECSSQKDKCISCPDGKLLDGSDCVESCDPGMSDIDGVCMKCPSHCLECDLAKCKKCEDGKVLLDGKCRSVCPNGYATVGNECIKCNPECLNCTTQSKCISCKGEYSLFYDRETAESKCILNCPEGTVGLENVCEECEEDCATCSISTTTCLSCKNDKNLIKGECSGTCPDGYTQKDGICVQCKSPCSECYTTPETCSKCVEGFFVDDEQCVSLCPTGKYGDKETGKCENCHNSCEECTETPTTCTACDSNKFLDADKHECGSACPDGTVINRELNKCDKCTSNCATCEERVDKCTSCIDGFYLYKNECITSCPEKTTLQNGKCMNCQSPCDDCSGTPETCTTCVANYTLFNNSCVTECPPVSIKMGDICVLCDKSCKECKNELDECTICADGYYKLESHCYSDCGQASSFENRIFYGLDSEKKECVKCADWDCLDCSSNYTKCDLCDPNFLEERDGCYPPGFILLDEGNCTYVEHCNYTVYKDKSVQVLVLVSQFTNKVQELNGGALYFINCAVWCNNTLFINCTSKGVGGAIYIKNYMEVENNVDLHNLTFFQCKAQYGGGMYIYSGYDINNVSIYNNKFYSNEVNNEYVDEKDKKLNGGSAVFITAKNCAFRGCTFENNKGANAAIKIYNKFDENNKKSAQTIKEDSLYGISIFNCQIKIGPREENSIFVEGKETNRIEINECKFTGKLRKGAKYIGGRLNYRNAKNVEVKNCEFEFDEKKTVKIDLLNDDEK